VRLTVRSAQDLYYVRVEDPLPAGAEAVDPTLLTTSQLNRGGYRVPPHTSDLAWYVSHVELRDDRAALFAPYLPAGVYRYEYTVQLTTRGAWWDTVCSALMPGRDKRKVTRSFLVARSSCF
jgi:alpha-2-macroglobulin